MEAECRPEIQDCSVPHEGLPLIDGVSIPSGLVALQSEWNVPLYVNLWLNHVHKLYIAVAPRRTIRRTVAQVRI